MSIYLVAGYCEKSPNTEFFLVHIFLVSAQIQENMDQKKTPYLDTFHAAGCYDLKTMLMYSFTFTSRYNIVSITRRNHIVHAFFAVQYIVLKHEQNIEEYWKQAQSKFRKITKYRIPLI